MEELVAFVKPLRFDATFAHSVENFSSVNGTLVNVATFFLTSMPCTRRSSRSNAISVTSNARDQPSFGFTSG